MKSAVWPAVLTLNSSTLSIGVGITPVGGEPIWHPPTSPLGSLHSSPSSLPWCRPCRCVLTAIQSERALIFYRSSDGAVGLTPGCSTAKVPRRDQGGSESKAVPETVLPIVAFIVCSSAPAVSVTVTVVADRTELHLHVLGQLRADSTVAFVISNSEKPDFLNFIVYVLGARSKNVVPDVVRASRPCIACCFVDQRLRWRQ